MITYSFIIHILRSSQDIVLPDTYQYQRYTDRIELEMYNVSIINDHVPSNDDSSSSSNSRTVDCVGAGGGGGGDDGDSSGSDDSGSEDSGSDDRRSNGGNANNNDDNDDNDNSDNNDNQQRQSPPSTAPQVRNSRYHATYRSGRYKGMLRYRAAMHYDPATFVYVTDVGGLTVECNHCHALKFDDEKPGICCNHGKVNIPIPSLPSELVPLLNGASPLSVPYLKHIQQYNNLINFTSFAANQQFILNRNGQRQWTPGFKVLGQIYHRIGPLFPSPNQPAAHLQIYFLSESEQFQRRTSIFEGLNAEIIRHNTAMINAHNPYVNEFKSAISTIRHSNIPNLKVIFR